MVRRTRAACAARAPRGRFAVREPRQRYTSAQGCLAKQFDFVPRERPRFSDAQALDADRSDRNPVERHDLVAELGEHAANFAFLALGEDQFEQCRLALTTDDSSPLGADLALREP
jgi:hypothetical protein